MRKMKLFVLFLFFFVLFVPAIFAQDYYNITPGSTQVIDKWSIKRTVTNNCPETIYVPVKTVEEWSAFSSNFPSCVKMVAPVCGDGICDSTENVSSCPDDCDPGLYPDSADVMSCKDSAGNSQSTTGKGSLTWFQYGGCPAWKTYKVTPKEPITLSASADDCVPCVCYHMNFCLSELVSGVWTQISCFNWGDTKGLSRSQQFIPYANETSSNDASQNQIMISADPGNCFYLNVYRQLKTSN
jgi:hypothetical protein